ncbi:hypothetical protein SELMODRAFT_406242 [Selaginella moellendorffii]|uniref:Uncharacterized protein n=1 Tax=Selaginella moellendorffii TaxID=88036 RepID=D8R1Q9_SELML|nr:hypothetical protein SELMODRAFT_406242 [Selaginella moellendorffii]
MNLLKDVCVLENDDLKLLGQEILMGRCSIKKMATALQSKANPKGGLIIELAPLDIVFNIDSDQNAWPICFLQKVGVKDKFKIKCFSDKEAAKVLIDMVLEVSQYIVEKVPEACILEYGCHVILQVARLSGSSIKAEIRRRVSNFISSSNKLRRKERRIMSLTLLQMRYLKNNKREYMIKVFEK